MDRFCLVLFVLFTTILSLVIFISAHPNVIVSWFFFLTLNHLQILNTVFLHPLVTMLSMIYAMSSEYLKQDRQILSLADWQITLLSPGGSWQMWESGNISLTASDISSHHAKSISLHVHCALHCPCWSSCHCPVWELRLCAFHWANHIRTFLHEALLNHPKNANKSSINKRKRNV